MLNERGSINNRKRAEQQIDYKGLLYGNITPTDIDGLIKYHNKGYVILEAKLKETLLLKSQRLALERMTDDLSKTGKSTICIIVRHEIDDPKQDIDATKTTVREYRWLGEWHFPKDICNTKDMIDWFIQRLDT